MHLCIGMVAFSKQCEQLWLQKTPNILSMNKKKNIIGPTIKKFEDCIVGRWILLTISFYDAFMYRYGCIFQAM